MANYFSLRDGLLTDTTTYGISISGAEKTTNTSAYTLTTNDSWSTVLTASSADVIDSIAVHLSSRSTDPVGVLSAQLDQYAGYVQKVSATDSTASPFGEGVDGSIYLNGTGSSYLRSTSPVPLSGDFTIELWIYPTVLGSTTNRIFIESWSSNVGWQLYYRYTPGSSITFYVNNSVVLQDPSPSRLTVNNWHHVAVTRQLSATRLFVNGVQVASAVNATNTNPTQPLNVGTQSTSNNNPFNGYISNIRIVNGTALYTSNFTPTGPLTLINNTTLLYQAPYTNAYKSSNAYLNTLVGTYPISSFTSYPLSWQLLKLSTPTSSGVFRLNFKTSNANQLTLLGTDTVSGVDYNRMCIRDSFISSPPINLYIGNVINGFSTENRTITASTATFNDVFIYKGGTLQFPTNSTTLRVSGFNGIQIGGEGALLIGTSSNPVPKDITHQILLSGNSIEVSDGGRLDAYGAYKVPYTRLTAPSNGGDGAFRVIDSVSGNWRVDDTLIFTPNTTNPSSYEERTLLNFAGDNWFNNTAANTFAHTVLDYVPNIANLTRNVKIGGVSNTAKGTIVAIDSAKVNINNTEFKFIDSSLLTGINSAGNMTLSGCTLSGSGTEYLIKPKPLGEVYATVFNGSTSYITDPTYKADYYVPTGTNFTIECFVKISTYVAFNPIFSVAIPSPTEAGDYSFRVTLRSSYVEFFGSNNSAINTPSNIIKLNKWHHIAVVGRNSKVYIYIDGVEQSSGNQVAWNLRSTAVGKIGYYSNISVSTNYYNGKISNLRFVKGLAVYTGNFTPPTSPLNAISDTGVTTPLLTMQNNPPIDNGYYNSALTRSALSYEVDSPFGGNFVNSNTIKNVVYKLNTGIFLENTYSNNNTISGNLILSSKSAGMYFDNSLSQNLVVNNNISIGPSIYGTYLKDNISNGLISESVNYNNTYGTYVDSNHIGVINGMINTYNISAGVYVDGSIPNLNSTTFRNITASNNKTVGFLVSGNSVNLFTPITLNINGLVANDNLSAGFEGYSISGNLSSLQLNRNGFYGMKTSLGNAPTIIDGVTALMSNVAGVSAAIGILSATNYHPTIIKNANVGKLVPSSVLGAAISLDSTKFSQFVVHSSTVSGGSSDFQLRTTRGVLEGSYLISNTNVGNLPVGAGITTSNYQPDVIKTTGFAFTNMNNASGYNVTYLAAGTRQIDSTVNISSETSPSERLTPKSTTIKLRSGSKFVALNTGESTTISVYVRKSTVASNGVAYNGTAPRLILKRNPYMGINSDIVVAQLNTVNENFLQLSGVIPAVTDSGVLEFYVDCDGTQGWINIDNWTAN